MPHTKPKFGAPNSVVAGGLAGFTPSNFNPLVRPPSPNDPRTKADRKQEAVDARAAVGRRKERKKSSRGRASTILTPPQGLTSREISVSRRTLLGS